MMRTLRIIILNFLDDVKESPWTFIRFVGIIALLVFWCVILNRAAESVRSFADDIHVIAEDIRNSD